MYPHGPESLSKGRTSLAQPDGCADSLADDAMNLSDSSSETFDKQLNSVYTYSWLNE